MVGLLAGSTFLGDGAARANASREMGSRWDSSGRSANQFAKHGGNPRYSKVRHQHCLCDKLHDHLDNLHDAAPENGARRLRLEIHVARPIYQHSNDISHSGLMKLAAPNVENYDAMNSIFLRAFTLPEMMVTMA